MLRNKHHCQRYKGIECCTTMLLWPRDVIGNSKTYLRFHVNCSIFVSSFKQFRSFSTDLNKNPPVLTNFAVSRQIWIKILTIKLHRNPSSGSRADAMPTDGRTDKWNVPYWGSPNLYGEGKKYWSLYTKT